MGVCAPAGIRRDEGIAALEFAIIAPFLLMILFGIIVYGVFFATWIAATEAASEGARASVAGLDSSSRINLANTAASSILAQYGSMTSCQPTTTSAGGSVTVSVACNFSQWGFGAFANLFAVPATVPTVSVIVANGG